MDRISFLRGPVTPDDEGLNDERQLLLDFIPFTPFGVSEADARRLKAILDPDIRVFGRFDGVPMKQLLYLFDEGLIDGAVIGAAAEKDLYRLAETFSKPLYLSVRSLLGDDLKRAERLPVDGLCFRAIPPEGYLKQRKKSCLLRLSAQKTPFEDWDKKSMDLLNEKGGIILQCRERILFDRAKAILTAQDPSFTP